MNWALRDPVRFLREQDEFEKLLKEKQWLKGLEWRIDSSLSLEVEIDLDIHGTTYSAKLTYPDLFPETPAYIRPRDRSQRWPAPACQPSLARTATRGDQMGGYRDRDV